MADANDIAATTQALKTFDATHDRPTVIIVNSHIGWGAPHKQDTAAAHGEPLGTAEARGAKAFYGFDPDASFAVPDGVREHFSAHFGQRVDRLPVAVERGLDVDVDNLYVKTAVANEGPRLKRLRPAPMGRAFRYQRRLTHIIITVAERPVATGKVNKAGVPVKASKAATQTSAAKKSAAKKATAK